MNLIEADMKKFTFCGPLRLFPQPGGWYYVAVPDVVTRPLAHLANRGLIPVSATVGSTSWSTSLLPMGDGTHFIAIRANVRKKEELKLRDQVEVTITARRP